VVKKKQTKTPLSALILLTAGVIIAVGGFGSGEAFNLSEGVAVVITVVSLIVGIALALWGLKRLRPAPPKGKRAKK